jgi:hypothetical protein
MATYSENLAGLTNDALKHGVPAAEIVFYLELMGHELKNSILANAAEQATKPKIIIPPPELIDGGAR